MNGVKTTHSRTGAFSKVGENLYRYSSSGVYYARYRNKGKEIKHSLNTTDREFAKRLLKEEMGKLRPLGRPNPNAVKFFSAVELIALLADREWLDETTKTIGQFWKRKNARRNGVTLGN